LRVCLQVEHTQLCPIDRDDICLLGIGQSSSKVCRVNAAEATIGVGFVNNIRVVAGVRIRRLDVSIGPN
jgi:hypothetical protein